MHFMVLAKLCHPYCTICTGDSNSVCTACNTAKSAMLSGTTCALTCMTYYGFNSSDPNVCIHCATNCTSCYDSALNCTKCISNHYLYFDGQNTTCINPCPSHTYVSGTTCTTCDANCSNCLSTSTYCTSCNLTYYLYNHVCYNPCPSLTYSINATSTCAKCNAYCLVCSVTSTNCSSCVLSGINQAFLKGTLCTKNCGNTYYPSTNGGVGPNLCLSCDPSCVTCLYNSTFCFSCFAGYYYLNNTCLTSCPFPAYFSNNATWSCLSCSATCVNMTMKIYFQNSLKNTLICDLAFTQALSWNSSDISNFISIS
jgi:proprotein convertase subtilisin/kexin type 5